MLRRMDVACVVIALSLLACGTPNMLPPRTPPTQQMPPVQVPAAAPLPGYGRVVLEVTDGPMNVAVAPQQRFTGGNAIPMASGPLCRTPCVADVPFGNYNLYFSGLQSDTARGDVAPLSVGEGLTVMRRAPGMYRTPPYFQYGPFAFGFGGTVLVSVGGAVIGSGADNAAVGGVLVIGGIAMLVGALATAQYSAEQQDGTSTVWTQPHPVAATQSPAATPSPANTPTPIEVTP